MRLFPVTVVLIAALGVMVPAVPLIQEAGYLLDSSDHNI
jgi:hypothetical protein